MFSFVPSLLILCILAIAANATQSVSQVQYSFVKPNTKSYVYVSKPAPLTITVEVSEFNLHDLFVPKFFADENHAITVVPTSACLDGDTALFEVHEGGLRAVQSIATKSTCSFDGVVTADSPNLVYAKFGLDLQSGLPVTPFQSSTGSFECIWKSSLVNSGASNTLTVRSDIVFEENDSFIITANNGAPFATASSCVGTKDGEILFTVTAQGSRLLFLARRGLSSSFECQVTITAAPTSLHYTNYTFAAAAYGLTGPVGSFVCALDRPDYHMRVGTHGSALRIPNSHASDNVLYLAFPAGAVRTGDAIRLHFAQYAGVNVSVCKYKDGSVAGQVTLMVDKQSISGSSYSGVLTLNAIPNSNTATEVEFFCPVQRTGLSVELSISAVTVPAGVFAVSPIVADTFGSVSLFDSAVLPVLASYNRKLTTFQVHASAAHDHYSYTNADFSLRGIAFKSVEDLLSQCSVTPVEKKEDWIRGMISVTNGEARFRIVTETILAAGDDIIITCELAVSLGQTLSVYDHMLGQVIAEELVHEGTFSLTFDDGVQNRYMSGTAVTAGYMIPFTLDILRLHSPSNVGSFESVEIYIRSETVDIVSISGVKCSVGDVSFTLPEIPHPEHSSLTITIKNGFDAKCTGYAQLSAYPTGTESGNFARVYMLKYVLCGATHLLVSTPCI